MSSDSSLFRSWHRRLRKALRLNLPASFVLWLIALSFFTPLLWMLLTSLKSEKEIYSLPLTLLPKGMYSGHYRYVLKETPVLFTYLRNSLVISIASVAAIAVLSSLAGYSFGRLEYPGQNMLFFLFIFILAVPNVVFLIPVYMMLSRFKLLNTMVGLILPYVALNLPLAIIVMRGTFRAMPSELEDAARIDGCSLLQVFWHVMLPLAKAGLTSAMVFSFLSVWEEFLFAVVIMSRTQNTTIAVGIHFLKEEAQSWAFGTLSATVILSVLPALVIFVLAQRYYIAGFLEGAIKG